MAAKDTNLSLQRFTFSDPNMHREILPHLDLANLELKHRSFSEHWEACAECKEYHDFFVDTIVKLKTMRVEQAMCLGLGSLSSVNYYSNNGNADQPMRQLVVFESLVKLLRRKFKIRKVFFQDPTFTQTDCVFLDQRGYQIIESPMSEEIISDETFLFVPGAEQYVTDSSLNHAHPVVLLGCGALTLQSSFFLNPRYEINKENESVPSYELELPSRDSANASRSCRSSYLRLRAAKEMPSFNSDYPQTEAIYYRPDSPTECSPFEFEYGDDELWEYDEALAYWDLLAKGREQASETGTPNKVEVAKKLSLADTG